MNWTSAENKTCSDYKKENYCTSEGELGDGWEIEWGVFEDYADKNNKSAKVCPECGCIAEGNVIETFELLWL